MARIDGGGMLVRVLEQEGIREVFTLQSGGDDVAAKGAAGEFFDRDVAASGDGLEERV